MNASYHYPSEYIRWVINTFRAASDLETEFGHSGFSHKLGDQLRETQLTFIISSAFYLEAVLNWNCKFVHDLSLRRIKNLRNFEKINLIQFETERRRLESEAIFELRNQLAHPKFIVGKAFTNKRLFGIWLESEMLCSVIDTALEVVKLSNGKLDGHVNFSKDVMDVHTKLKSTEKSEVDWVALVKKELIVLPVNQTLLSDTEHAPDSIEN